MSASLKNLIAVTCWLLILVVEVAWSGDDKEKIVAIEFQGNNKTNRRVLVQELEIQVGDPFKVPKTSIETAAISPSTQAALILIATDLARRVTIGDRRIK